MKILLVTNKTLNRNGINKFDSGYFNVYVPLLELGHQVHFYDIGGPHEKEFMPTVVKFKPDLIFCCLTGNRAFMPGEPRLERIQRITEKGNIKTFNWFCDDAWRFDSFSSKVCKYFSACSTPEPSYIKKYKEIGYYNILLGAWHSNVDLYPKANKEPGSIGFCGVPNTQRRSYMTMLQRAGYNVNIQHGLSYEDMLFLYSSSQIGINFSINANGGITQMKQRMFEIPAADSALITEYAEGLENFFELEKEIITFKDRKEFFLKTKELVDNPLKCEEIAKKGHRRFLREHNSKVRLEKVLKQIEAI